MFSRWSRFLSPVSIQPADGIAARFEFGAWQPRQSTSEETGKTTSTLASVVPLASFAESFIKG
jgi:hypothetical protein